MLARTSLVPWLLALCSLLSILPQGQEPKPTPAATPVPAVPPAPTPATVPGKPSTHSLEGVYELRKRVIRGQDEGKPSRGYVAITKRHMFLCLVGPGTDPDLPLLRSGVRTWKPEDDLMREEVKLGYFTDQKGAVHIERPGTAEVHRVQIILGGLRIYQDTRSWLEFERIE